jgi:glyoxylase-like metal-dependent hydrolase (beta-lactamase superfamily II)
LEIAEGIHLIPRVRGANAYLVRSNEGITVVGTGLPGSAGKILAYVESIGCHPSDVKTIVLTHSDMDHAGSAARLKEETHAKVAIHEADAPGLSGEKEWKRAKGISGFFFRVISAVMRFSRLKADVPLKDSDIIDGLTVIHTPGHTEGSICLYLPARALFVGDALLTDDERTLSLPRKSMSMDMDQAKESIKKASQLEYSVLLPGHGPPIEQNASGITKEFLARF